MKPLFALAALAAAVSLPTMNVLRVAAATTAGETITIGTTVLEIKTLGHTITTGRVAIDLTASPTAAKASKVLTLAANLTAADTVTIGTQVYTFRASLTAPTTAGEVLIGADLTATRNNLVAAVTGAAGGGTTYGSATVVNTAATAVATSTNAATVTALVAGTAGNSIAIAEAAAQASWAGAATALSGGVDPTAVESVAAIVIAINGCQSGMRATASGTNEILCIGTGGNGTALACTETLAGSNNAWAAATSYGGTALADTLPVTKIVKRAALAVEVAVGAIRFPLNFTPTAAFVSVTTSAGVFKAWDGVTTLGTNLVSVDNSGSSDWAAGDIITVIASK